MSKELFMAAHQQLIEEYMAEHPEADAFIERIKQLKPLKEKVPA